MGEGASAPVPTPSTAIGHGRGASPATRILETLRAEPVVLREDLARRTELSPATVTRTTSALITAGLVRQRDDCSVLGRMGRPAIPLALEDDRHVCLGIHIGRETITLAAGDLRGTVLSSVILRHVNCASPPIALVARTAGQLLNEFLDRELLTAGVVAPWRALGLSPAHVATQLRVALGLPVTVGEHVEAIVAAQVLRQAPPPGLTCYLYVRNVPGFALVHNDGTETGVSLVADLTHLPTGSGHRCPCGRRGCFEASVGERGVVARALRAGAIDRPSMASLDAAVQRKCRPAVEIVEERATLLGNAAGLVRDLYAPDHMILLGQAFDTDPGTRASLVRSFEESTAFGPIDLTVPERADNVQAAAACFVALRPVYEDPLGLLDEGSSPVVFRPESTRRRRAARS